MELEIIMLIKLPISHHIFSLTTSAVKCRRSVCAGLLLLAGSTSTRLHFSQPCMVWPPLSRRQADNNPSEPTVLWLQLLCCAHKST